MICDYNNVQRGPEARKRAREQREADPIYQLTQRAKLEAKKASVEKPESAVAPVAAKKAAPKNAALGTACVLGKVGTKSDVGALACPEKILAAAYARDAKASGSVPDSATGPRKVIGTAGIWHENKGFGFIIPDEGSVKQLFCHMYDIEDGNALVPGARVQYETEYSGEKGAFIAVKITGGAQVERFRDKIIMQKHGHTGKKGWAD